LGNLLHLHYPDKVPWSGGASFATTYWANYGLSPNVMYGNVQGVMGCEFWVMLEFENAEMIPLAE
jgi:hypothetical protein